MAYLTSPSTVQGYSSIIPVFTAVDFVSLYIEIPVMIVMYLGWMLIKRPDPNAEAKLPSTADASPVDGSLASVKRRKWYTSDLVDIHTVDLVRDEYLEQPTDELDDKKMEARYSGKWRLAWKAYYWVI